jgi:cytochrome c peroxidase
VNDTSRQTRFSGLLARVVLVLALLAGASDAAVDEPGVSVLAPGWTTLRHAAPVPGTYELPRLGSAADGQVLNSDGSERSLHELLGEKISVLSFIYTHCPDVNACPLATYSLTKIQQRVLEEPALSDRVRLLSLSFDPIRDRPAKMRAFGDHVVRPGVDWRFLTTDSEESLRPILQSYGQSVQRDFDANGQPPGTFTHILRVYLIDRDRQIRNIYTTSFLHADTVISDIQTLLSETSTSSAAYASDARASQSLHGRAARAADLMALHGEPPLGLPPVPVPADNPITAEKISLGRKLFFDRRLSGNGTISCAMCHIAEQGFTSNEMATAVGIEGRTVQRNAPTVLNVAYAELLFHDGRENLLEQQVWAPLLAANEMGNPSIGYVLDQIRALPDYTGLFEAAFPAPRGPGGRGPTMETVGMAIASYERTLLAANSPFDRWNFASQPDAISPASQRGLDLFTGKAGCASCHSISEKHALFTDQKMHNTGIGYRRAMGAPDRNPSVQVAPGMFLNIDPSAMAGFGERRENDLGRYAVTGEPDDRWKYKTPTLRNIALTAPYMHDGSFTSLREIVEFYNTGGFANPLLDPRIRPLGLDDEEIGDLVAFLESLTGGNVGDLVADSLAAPVGDPGRKTEDLPIEPNGYN